jgi:hypothetical protein
MKKVLCLMIGIMLLATPALARDLEPGTISIGARSSGLDFMSTTEDIKGVGEFDTDAWAIDLNGEYYVLQNVGIGVVFQYSNLDMQTPLGDAELTTWLIGPQAVYNFSVSEEFSVPVFGVVGYVSADDGESDDLTGWGWALGGGGRWFLAPVVSLDGYLFYQAQYLDNDILEVDTDGWSAQIGFSVYLGGQ